MEKPSINLGNNDWATKESKLLGYNIDDQNYYDPIEFDVTRASTKTSVGRDGLIKTNANNIASIDFNGDVKGKLNLEPQSTNLIPYSQSFDNSDWFKSNSSVTADSIISPDGTLNADKLTDSTANGTHQITDNITTASGVDYSISCFMKKGNLDYGCLSFANNDVDSAIFDLNTGVVSFEGSNVISSSITLISNGWYLCSISFLSTSTGTIVRLLTSFDGTNRIYTGTGTDYIYLYGAQLEALSYPTSYIKTDGSTVTRVGDLVNGAGSVDSFNSTEGVLYVEMSALANDGGHRWISISDGTFTNQIVVYFSTTSNQIVGRIYASAANTQVNTTNYTVTDSNKIAFRWELNKISLFINGVLIGNSTPSTNLATNVLNKLNFSGGSGGEKFYGNVKDLRVYKTALTDTELTTLTTI